MRCGAKCFAVEMESNGEKKSIPVTGRSSTEVRKAVRIEYGEKINILSVKEDKRKSK